MIFPLSTLATRVRLVHCAIIWCLLVIVFLPVSPAMAAEPDDAAIQDLARRARKGPAWLDFGDGSGGGMYFNCSVNWSRDSSRADAEIVMNRWFRADGTRELCRQKAFGVTLFRLSKAKGADENVIFAVFSAPTNADVLANADRQQALRFVATDLARAFKIDFVFMITDPDQSDEEARRDGRKRVMMKLRGHYVGS